MPSTAPYWKKAEEDIIKHALDLAWNFPEQRQGVVSIVGGNASAFLSEVKTAEYINKSFTFLKGVKNIFPDALKSKLPPIDSISYFKSTDSGSFASSSEFRHALEDSDVGLLLGDFSKNSNTSIAVSELIKNSSDIPLILARDSAELVVQEINNFIERDNLFFVTSMASLQKIFRALYYPRPIMLSQPIFPVIETLHKFTLSYKTAILTFHEGKIICAKNGNIVTIDLEKTRFTPVSLWSGELAANLAVFAMFNKQNPLEVMIASAKYDKSQTM